jgi:hypothetical protein
MNIAFYHAYLTEEVGAWLGVVLEQMKLMEDCELFENLSEFHVTAVSRTQEDGNNFSDFIKLYYPNANVEIVINPFENDQTMLTDFDGLVENNITETHTLKKLQKRASEVDANILYFHTKAITAFQRHVIGKQGEMNRFRTYCNWRHFLNWGVLEKWRLCVNLLKDYDCAGANYGSNPVPHYSGTFWWSKSEHINQLPSLDELDWYQNMKDESSNGWFKYQASKRFADEMWIGAKKETTFANVGKFVEEQNPANQYTPRKLYHDKAYA